MGVRTPILRPRAKKVTFETTKFLWKILFQKVFHHPQRHYHRQQIQLNQGQKVLFLVYVDFICKILFQKLFHFNSRRRHYHCQELVQTRGKEQPDSRPWWRKMWMPQIHQKPKKVVIEKYEIFLKNTLPESASSHDRTPTSRPRTMSTLRLQLEKKLKFRQTLDK